MSTLNNLKSPEKKCLKASLFFRLQTLILNGEICMIHFVLASHFSYAPQTHRDARAVRIHRTLRSKPTKFQCRIWFTRHSPMEMQESPAGVFTVANDRSSRTRWSCWVWLRVSMDGNESCSAVVLWSAVVFKYKTQWNKDQKQNSSLS